ncbi:MAG: hypothetical protein ACK5LX_03525 [Oscillospiraceae bacterium]
MKDRIYSAFDSIRADEALLQTTAAHLNAERAKREKRGKRVRIRPLPLAAALAATVMLAVGILGYRTVYSTASTYVSVDVNPSVELTLNPMDTVIGAVAYNPEGEALLLELDLKGKGYSDAVSLLIAEMGREGYLSGDALVTMTVQTADGAKEQLLCRSLQQAVGGQVDVEVFPVTQEVRESAHGCHMSAAKYLAIQDLMEVDGDATLEEYSDSSIGQIRQRTRECREAHGEEQASSGGGNHSGQGSGQGQGGHGHGSHGG